MNRSCNPGVAQSQSVVPGHACRLIRKPGFMERSIQEIAGPVPGEHSSRPIGAVRAGRESDDKKAGLRIAERRHGKPPILLIPIGPPLCLCDLLAVLA